ncbi:MAG: hypothetical protein JWO53_1034, partial [Chlamydiia bacterium]|nr:hypothetical protein [Chlamydiia bacterium]
MASLIQQGDRSSARELHTAFAHLQINSPSNSAKAVKNETPLRIERYATSIFAMLQEQLPLPISTVIREYLPFPFQIHSPYRPHTFTEEDDCSISFRSFAELREEHFVENTEPYFVALVEDTSQNSSLYALDALKTWFELQQWNPEKCRNPNTRMICERISILGLTVLGDTLSLVKCTSILSFKKWRTVSPLSDSYFVKQVIYSQFHPYPVALQDEEIFNWLHLLYFPCQQVRIGISHRCLQNFVHGPKYNPERIDSVLSQLDLRFKKNLFVQQFLGEYYYPIGGQATEASTKAIHHYKNVLTLVPRKDSRYTHYILRRLAKLYTRQNKFTEAFTCMYQISSSPLFKQWNNEQLTRFLTLLGEIHLAKRA